jgi:hypothetical protein
LARFEVPENSMAASAEKDNIVSLYRTLLKTTTWKKPWREPSKV